MPNTKLWSTPMKENKIKMRSNITIAKKKGKNP